MGVIDALSDSSRDMVRTGGWLAWLLAITAVLTAVAMLSYPFLSVRGRKRAAYLSLLAIALFVWVDIFLVARGRGLMRGTMHKAADDWATRFASGCSLDLNARAVLGVFLENALLLAAIAMAIPWLIARRRAQRRVLPALLTAFSLAGVPVFAAQALLSWTLAIIRSFEQSSHLLPGQRVHAMSVALSDGAATLTEARRLLVWVGCVALAATVLRAVRSARRGEVVGNQVLAVGAILFVLGASAYALTRNQAVDAANPLSDEAMNPLDLSHSRPPRVQACGPLAARVEPGPILTIGDLMTLNGFVLGNFEDFSSDLVTLWNNQRLLHPDDMASGLKVWILANADVAAPSLLSGLRRAKLPSGASLWLAAIVPQRVVTRTMGTLDRAILCLYELKLGEGPSFATFGALADALSHAQQPFIVGADSPAVRR